MSIQDAITQLQDGLEKLADEGHGEFHDTTTRAILYKVIENGLTSESEIFHVQENLQMFTTEGNQYLQVILLEFLNHPAIVSSRRKGTARSDVKDVVKAMGIDCTTYDMAERDYYLCLLGLGN